MTFLLIEISVSDSERDFPTDSQTLGLDLDPGSLIWFCYFLFLLVFLQQNRLNFLVLTR